MKKKHNLIIIMQYLSIESNKNPIIEAIKAESTLIPNSLDKIYDQLI